MAATKKKRTQYRRIRVYVREEDEAKIKSVANAAGMSVSSYLRHCGLKKKIRSQVDRDAMNDIVKASADLGRLGGLLKHWLTRGDEALGDGIKRTDITSLLRDLMKTQIELMRLAEAGRNDRKDY